MAKSDNIMLRGLHGRIGNGPIIKQCNGKTVMCAPPRKSKKPSTAAQTEQKYKLIEAVCYAKRVADDPELSEIYRKALKPGESIYRKALTDFMRSPWISGIKCEGYNGNSGDRLRIYAGDYFMITRVSVTITDKNGNLIEQGDCTDEGVGWEYEAKVKIEDVSGFSIMAIAYDIPGHNCEFSTSIL